VRAFVLLLIAANALLYAFETGAFGPVVRDGHEPQRLAEQIEPDKIKLLSADSPVAQPVALALAPAIASSGRTLACIEFGGFNADETHRADQALAALDLGSRLSQRHADDQATYIVYLPPYKTKADADHAAAELRRIGVTDFFVIQDPGPFHLAISLGIFHSEEGAKGLATTLSQQGVKNAKTGERSSTIAKTYYQIRPADPATMARLSELHGQFPNQDLHECAASGTEASSAASLPASTAASSSGT
jgi:hypothetical protein